MTGSGDDFLLTFHRLHPGVTARAFARGALEDGRSTYDLLADEVPPGATVLDLGCGDGYLLERLRARGVAPGALIGVDMSADELDAARRRPALAGVSLRCERAQAMSVPDAAVSCVVSHLAFTLMSDIERVVAEIARVLAPGGLFLAVVGGGPRLGDTFDIMLEILIPIVTRQPARPPRVGDVRARKPDGLRQLLGPHTGFAPDIETRPLTVALDGTFDQVWSTLSTIYEMHYLADADRALVRDQLMARVAPAGPATRIPCTMVATFVRCRRAAP